MIGENHLTTFIVAMISYGEVSLGQPQSRVIIDGYVEAVVDN